jgi:hypothetical protein
MPQQVETKGTPRSGTQLWHRTAVFHVEFLWLGLQEFAVGAWPTPSSRYYNQPRSLLGHDCGSMGTWHTVVTWDLMGGRVGYRDHFLETQATDGLFLLLDVTPELLQPSCTTRTASLQQKPTKGGRLSQENCSLALTIMSLQPLFLWTSLVEASWVEFPVRCSWNILAATSLQKFFFPPQQWGFWLQCSWVILVWYNQKRRVQGGRRGKRDQIDSMVLGQRRKTESSPLPAHLRLGTSEFPGTRERNK